MKDSFFTRGPVKLRTMADVNAKLAQRTGKPVEGVSGERGCGVPLAPQPDGAKPSPTPAALEWAEPVRHGDGSGFQLSTNAVWSVVKERQIGGGWIYRLFRRWPLAELVHSADSAQEARDRAQQLHSEQP